MPTFRYTARRADGELVEATLQSTDRAGAIALIEQQQCVPIKIDAVADARNGDTAARSNAAPRTLGTITHTQKHLFTEQLAHLLSAGMTLDEALGILVRRLKHPRLQSLSETLHRALIEGRSLSQTMRDYPKIFSTLYVNMVAAGEASGALPEILRRLVVHLSDVKALRDRVQQALIYPAVLAVAGIGLVVVFMTVMVPRLTGFFASTGQALPLPTRIILAANHLMTHYWWVAVLAGFGIYALFKALTRASEGRRAWDRFALKIPLYGRIARYRFYAQFARTLGTLVENGVTLLKALELLEDSSGNEYIRHSMSLVRESVMDGSSLSNALIPHHVFPELFIDMLAVGEQTGRFGETMSIIAEVYERELDKQVKITSALIPPLIMLVIATVVGLVVYGILSAVFNLTTGLRTRT